MNLADVSVLTILLIIVAGICYNQFKSKKQKSTAACAGCNHPTTPEGDAVTLKEALKTRLRR